MAINNVLHTSFPWYINNSTDGDASSAVAKKYKNHPENTNKDVFKLIAHPKRLLPFQYFIPTYDFSITNNSFTLTDWVLVKSRYSNPFAVGIPGGDRFDLKALLTATGIYNRYVKFTGVPNKGLYVIGLFSEIDLPNTINPTGGNWYMAMKFADGRIAVSEDIYVACELSFDTKPNILRIDWFSTKDRFNILYQFTDFSSGFRNRLYLDTDLLRSESKEEEEGIQNERGEFIQTGLSVIDMYNLQDFMPEYLYRALILAKGHDICVVWNRGYLHGARMLVRECKMDFGDTGIDGLVSVTFEQRDMNLTESGCGNNYSLGSPVPLVGRPDTIVIYPKLAVGVYNVCSNDSGVGLYVQPVASISVYGGTKVSLSANGSVSIIVAGSLPSVASSTTPAPYYLNDSFASGIQAIPWTIIVSDWIPTEDNAEISWLEVRNGKTLFDVFNSVFANDSYPVNITDVTVVTGIYYDINGSGNYVTMAANGTYTLKVVNSSGVFGMRFLIVYNSATAGNGRSQWLNIDAVV